jgi:toxin YoeB
MTVLYEPKGQADLLYWFDTDKRTLGKVLNLVKEITRTPYEGSGQPEPLKHHLTGFWSRRIDKEHRLVYKHDEAISRIEIVSCRGHYSGL